MDKKVSVSTLLLVIAIMVIGVMGYMLYNINNQNNSLEKQVEELANKEPEEVVIKENSFEFHKISSSQKRLKCIIQIDSADASSITKSRSDTPSMEFKVTESKPSSSATI